MEIPWKWTRDEAIEICLEALATGCVYGVSANHDPDILTTGTNFGQNSSGDLGMWRSWTLFEAHFGRWRADMRWRCGFLMVQSWRIKKPPKFTMLQKELNRYGFEFDFAGLSCGSEYQTVAASGSRANIDRNNEKYLGRVLKIHIPAMPNFPGQSTSSPGDRAAVVRDLAAIASAPADSWPAWLDRQQLTPGDLIRHLDTLRSLHLHLPAAAPVSRPGPSPTPLPLTAPLTAPSTAPPPSTSTSTSTSPPSTAPSPPPSTAHSTVPAPAPVPLSSAAPGRLAAWGIFGRWLLEEARTRSIWSADEWAWRWADFVVDHPGLAAPGEVARECLAALPMTPAEAAALPADWRSLTPQDVHRSRTTMALLRLAADDVPPPTPTPGLAEWVPFLRNHR